MSYSFYNDSRYRKEQSERTKQLWKEGRYDSLKKPINKRICKNPSCGTLFEVKSFDPNIYCSHSCSATVNNKHRMKVKKKCLHCGNGLRRSINTYCSGACKQAYYYENYIKAWKDGSEDGNIGKTVITISHHLRRYLLKKFGTKCSICGWSEQNPITEIVPLEIDHIDGNHKNNKEENLRVICPNCHALTSTFKNLNKGKGRAWRIKYLKSLSEIV